MTTRVGGGRGGGVHTVHTDSGWANRVDGRITSEHKTKAAAEAAGRRQAMALQVEHTIHKLDGRIGEKNSYGNEGRGRDRG